MAPSPNINEITHCTPIVNQKNEYLSKWNLVFSKNSGSAWISFKPQLGLHVYPCYACRDMFSSKITFQDHINRRAILIKYNCKDCNKNLSFYNRCSLLLHARTHFSLIEGKIDLDNIEIFSLPFGMMGFLPHPGIDRLFDTEEDTIDENLYINTQFYSPEVNERGKQIILLKPNDLLFSDITQLTLKQISSNIPLCIFVTLNYLKELRQDNSVDISRDIKEEISEIIEDEPEPRSELTPSPPQNNVTQIPVISRIESLSCEESAISTSKCPECNELQKSSMKAHFNGNNMPFDQTLTCTICKYVASTKCSFSAHERIHSNTAPFVCPECGKKFESMEYLMIHLDDVCFHLAKQVRIRCPGKKCGKLFASPTTFVVHFSQHIQVWFQCTVCEKYFENSFRFEQHAKSQHSHLCYSERVYECLGCRTEKNILFKDNIQKHIQEHSTDRSRCMYVFVCKFCKNHFRSTLTFANHLLKCLKMLAIRKQGLPFSLGNCSVCQNRIIYYEDETLSKCSRCHFINNMNPNGVTNPTSKQKMIESSKRKKYLCLLCKENISNDVLEDHAINCTYRNPKIILNKLNNDTLSNDLNNSDISNDSENLDNSDKSENNDDSPKQEFKSLSPKSQENFRRKRKKAPLAYREKKRSFSPQQDINDLQADEATPFDGTYYCKLCDFKNEEREIFHEHIISHRDVSTSYQCMECGECFVVKPSFLKHLMHYHKIEDANIYLESNDCYDRNEVEKLKEIMKLVPGESREPVKENQCRVCLKEFSDNQEMRKHFRIHGMAFLMKNTRD